MSYFDKTPAGSIVSRLTNDTETISDMFSGILSSFISAVFIFLTTLYTMLVLDFRLTALVLQNGQIIERGRHEDLLAMDGWYAQTYQSQQLEMKG